MPDVPELPAPDDTDLSDYVKRIESRARERAPTTVKGTYIGTLLGAAAFGPIGHGGTERMIVYPVMLWLVAFGGYLLGESDHGTVSPW